MQQQTENHAIMRSNNQRILLESIYSLGTTTRTFLSQTLKLSKPAVTDHMSGLLEAGIVYEQGKGISTKAGGRRPIMVHFNPTFKYILALDLNYQNPFFAIGDLYGNIIDEMTISVSAKTNATARVSLVISTIRLLLEKNSLTAEDLCYIAISAPGIFDDKNRLCFGNAQFSEWFKIDIFSKLSEYFGVSVLVKNDVKTAMTGELNFGAGVHCQSMLFFSCGMGIGSAFALCGHLYEGDNFSAGEIFNYVDVAKLGAGTTLEQTVCLDALLRVLGERIQAGSPSMLSNIEEFTFQDVVTAYRFKDPLVLETLKEIGMEIGCAISNIANLLAIESVIFGGEYLAFSDILLPIIQQIADAHCTTPLTVCPSKLEHHAGIFGLFHLARTAYFDQLCNSKLMAKF